MDGGADFVTGVLIAESIRIGTETDLPALEVRRLRRVHVDDDEPVWTLLSFRAARADADRLAQVLSSVLRPDGGWYADFGDAAEHWVVFAGRVFRYVPGVADGRRAAEEYGRSIGIPAEQLDWRDAAAGDRPQAI